MLVAAAGIAATPATAGAVDPPPNDDIADAVELTPGVEVRFNLQGATIEPGEVTCDADPTVWYSFTAPEPGNYVTYATGSDFDTEIGWYSDIATATGSCPDDANDSFDGVEAPLAFAAGDEAFVQIGASADAELGTGSVGVVELEAATDDFADAMTLTKAEPTAPTAVLGLDFSVSSTSEPGESSVCGATSLGTSSGWVDFVPDSSGTWMIEGKSSSLLTLAVYSGDAVDDLDLLHCATDDRKAVLVDLTQGQTYRIRLSTSGRVVVRAERASVLAAAELVDADGAGTSTNVGSASSLASVGDLMAVAYYDADEGALRYAERSASGTWSDVLVDDDGDGSSTDVGRSLALVELASGQPGIAYRDDTNGEVRFAQRDSGGAWSDELVDADGPGTSTDVGSSLAAVVLDSGQPAIAYLDDTERALRFAERDTNGVWSDVLVDADGDGGSSDVGVNPSMAVGPSGAVGISYTDGSAASVRLAERNNGTWSDSVVMNFAGSPFGSSMHYASTGSPVVAATTSELGDIVHHTIATRNGGVWTYETDLGDRALAELDSQCVPPVLLLDPADNPYLLWMDCNLAGTLAVSYRIDGTWVIDDLLAYDTSPTNAAFVGSLSARNSTAISAAWNDSGRLSVSFANNNRELWFAEDALLADAGDASEARTLDTIALDASQSVDRFGAVAAYEWSAPGCVLEDAETAIASMTCAVAGDYLATVTVTDTDGNTSRATVAVTVVDPRPGDDQIFRLYQAAFGRTPDASGLSFWQGRYRVGVSLAAIAAEFRASGEFIELYGATPTDADFVDALYLNVLGRAGEAEGRAFWLDRLASGATQSSVLVAFSESPENIEGTGTSQPLTSAESQIFRLYRAAFGRLADAGGFEFWTARYASGSSLAVIAGEFRASDEFQARYGDALTDAEYVDLLYQNVLGRPGEDDGVAFWLSRLADDGIARDAVLVSFAESPENVAGTGTVPAGS